MEGTASNWFCAIETRSRPPKPFAVAAGGQAQFMDLAGDGQPDLVVLEGPLPGLYEHDGEEGWQPFRPFTSRLYRDTRDPNLKFVDLDGDGHVDVLITEAEAFVWYPSLAEEGFGPAQRMAQALDEEKGPRLVFADGTQSIYLADGEQLRVPRHDHFAEAQAAMGRSGFIAAVTRAQADVAAGAVKPLTAPAPAP